MATGVVEPDECRRQIDKCHATLAADLHCRGRSKANRLMPGRLDVVATADLCRDRGAVLGGRKVETERAVVGFLIQTMRGGRHMSGFAVDYVTTPVNQFHELGSSHALGTGVIVCDGG